MSVNSIIIISGPSAIGKTTVVEKLLEKKNFGRVITCTSRRPRNNEKNYIFLGKKRFQKKINNQCFLEYSIVYNNYYGILKTEFERVYKKYLYSLIVLDTKGSKTLMTYCKEKEIFCKSIFLSLPNKEEIEKRLLIREEKEFYSNANIDARLAAMQAEFQSAKDFDRQIYNASLKECVKEIEQFIFY